MKDMLTTTELSQLRLLKREIAAEKERLAAVRALLGPGARRLDGMPRAGGAADPTAACAAELCYLEQLIAENMQRAVCELLRLQRFINDIPDSETRQIFSERYIKGRSWLAVAFRLGWSDEQIPRKKHDKFLRRWNEARAEEKKG